MMEIDMVAAHILPAHVLVCVHHAKELVGFSTIEKLRVQEFGYPIHLMSVGKVKGDLDVLVGVLDHNDAIVVNVFVFPFTFEKDGATRLHFGCSKPCLLEK
jgi:hypothetical protein